MQREITERGPLLDTRGRLCQPGWARGPVFDANLEDAAPGVLGRLRVKRWDYYGVWTPTLFASATLAHLGYAGMAFVYVVDLATGQHVEHERLRLLGTGIDLPRNSESGDTSYDDGRLRVAFRVSGGRREIDVTDTEFDGGRGLRITASLRCRRDHDSIVVATPMGGGRFYYNRKINGMPASGEIVWGEHRVQATPQDSLGQLDWGRGVWPYRSHWIWAAGNGFLSDGRVLGLNLGAGFGDLSFGTENAIFVNGRLHKLGAVQFEFDAGDYRKPWRVIDDAGRLDLKLVPAIERVAHSNLGIIRSEVHQLFGRYTGRVVTDGGERIEVRGLPGFAEEHYARW